MKALIADDDVFVRKCMKQMIPWSDLGFSEVLTAENGTQALKCSLSQMPDLVISDVKMPGLTGLELVEKLKDSMTDVCMIILSEYSDFSFVQEALQAGVQDYILKPINHEKLVEITQKIRRLTAELEKNSFYGSGPAGRENIRNLLQRMLETGDAREACQFFEQMIRSDVPSAGRKSFGMKFLEILFEEASSSPLRQPILEEEKSRVLQTYSAQKSISGLISLVQEECRYLAGTESRPSENSVDYAALIDEYIEDHFTDPDLSVSSISDWLHLSPVYTGTIYKQRRGKSIISRIHVVRMRHARELLLESNENVAMISQKVGYVTPDYFSRLFSTTFGMTPSSYRAAILRKRREKDQKGFHA